MLGLIRHGLQNVLLGLRWGLARQGVHDVQVHAVHGFHGGFNSLSCLLAVMNAAQRFQGLIVKALNAQRNPVHATVCKIHEARGFGSSRIGFQRNFCVGQQVQVGTQQGQHTVQRLG